MYSNVKYIYSTCDRYIYIYMHVREKYVYIYIYLYTHVKKICTIKCI